MPLLDIGNIGLTLLNKEQFQKLDALCDASTKMNVESVFQKVAEFVGTEKFIKSLRMQRSLFQRQMIIATYNLLEEHSLVFKDALGCIEFDGANGFTIPIPDEFLGLLEIFGDGTGCGELPLLLFLKNEARCNGPLAAHDLSIRVGDRWLDVGIKDGTGLMSTKPKKTKTKRFRTTQASVDDPFMVSSIIKWLESLNFDIHHFSPGQIEYNEDFERAVMDRYGLSLPEAAVAFEKEFQEAFSLCHVVGHGMLLLGWLDGLGGKQRCWEYVDKAHIFFSNYDKMGIHVTLEYGRFEKAIMKRTNDAITKAARLKREAERAEEKKQIELKKAQALKAEEERRAENKKQRDEREAKKLVKKRIRYQRELERAVLIERFATIAHKYNTIAAIADALCIKATVASALKKTLADQGYTITLKPKEQKKNENRNRRRGTKTRDKGTLGPDTPRVAGE